MTDEKNAYENTQEANAQIVAITPEKRKKKKDRNESMHEANKQIGGI